MVLVSQASMVQGLAEPPPKGGQYDANRVSNGLENRRGKWSKDGIIPEKSKVVFGMNQSPPIRLSTVPHVHRML